MGPGNQVDLLGQCGYGLGKGDTSALSTTDASNSRIANLGAENIGQANTP